MADQEKFAAAAHRPPPSQANENCHGAVLQWLIVSGHADANELRTIRDFLCNGQLPRVAALVLAGPHAHRIENAGELRHLDVAGRIVGFNAPHGVMVGVQHSMVTLGAHRLAGVNNANVPGAGGVTTYCSVDRTPWTWFNHPPDGYLVHLATYDAAVRWRTVDEFQEAVRQQWLNVVMLLGPQAARDLKSAPNRKEYYARERGYRH